MNKTVQVLTSEELTEISGGLSPKAMKVAKITGITAAGVVGAVGAAAAVTAIVGQVQEGDAAHYFKVWFGGKKDSASTVAASKFDKHYKPGDCVLCDPAWDPETLPEFFKED